MAGTLYVAADESNRGLDPEYYAIAISADPKMRKSILYYPFLDENPDLFKQVIISPRVDYRTFSARRGQIEAILESGGIVDHPDDFKLAFAASHLLKSYLEGRKNKRYDDVELLLDGDVTEPAKAYLRRRMKDLPRITGKKSLRDFPKGKRARNESCEQPQLLVYAHAIVSHARLRDAPLFVRP